MGNQRKVVIMLTVLALSLLAAAGSGLPSQGATTKPPATPVQAIAIRHVRLFDGGKVIPDATVVIAKGVIVAAGPDAKAPEGAAVVDGSGKTLLPGFIDAHTHVFPGSLERALRFGVTTELDMFTSLEFLRPLKEEQKAGAATHRADLLSAGILVTVAGGHGSEYFKIPTYTPGGDPQKFIDERLAEGSDYIKLIYDDGKAYGITFPTLTKGDLKALIAAARKRGRLAVVHVGSLAGARDAIEAGADGLAHIFADQPPDPDFSRFAAAHHVFVIPTLTVEESVTGTPSGESLISDANLKPYLEGSEISNLKAAFPKRFGSNNSLDNALQAVRQLKGAAVLILAGTDAPNPGTAHGASIHRELQLLVRAGLSPVEALAAATSVPAAVFHLKDRGRVAPGLRADLVLVNGDPTTDILATRDIVTVWKGGAFLARERETAQAQAEVDTVPAEKLARGVISDFDNGTPAAELGTGGWVISTDAIMGGQSTATMEVVGGGANGSPKSLRVHAETKEGSMYPWSGVMLTLGTQPMRPVDLSGKKGIAFFAKGGTGIRVMLFASSGGRIPRVKIVQAGPDWTEIFIPWSDFGVDGKDVQALLFAGSGTGTADFQVDEVRLMERVN